MTTTALHDLLRLARRALLPLVIVLFAGGCSPGSGGTGTGPHGPIWFGTPSAAASGAPVPGSGRPGDLCGVACGSARLRLDADGADLRVGCSRFVFTLDWREAAPVWMVTGIGPAGQAVSLRLGGIVDGEAAATRVEVTLLDAAGQVLVGPVELERQAVQQEAAACP